MGVDFSPEQKRWIEGFTSGAAAVRGAVRSVPVAASPAAPAEPTGPDASLVRAQDRAASAGKKLVDQEKWKRAEHPMDAYARLKSQALAGAKPKPEDNFRWRYHGLFYVAPAQDSYMCRMRVPNGILTHAQLSAIADLAERYGGGYADVTTRANLQVREILPQNGPATVEALAEARHPRQGRRRRQHPQRHRLGHCGDRSARADRHAAARARVASPCAE